MAHFREQKTILLALVRQPYHNALHNFCMLGSFVLGFLLHFYSIYQKTNFLWNEESFSLTGFQSMIIMLPDEEWLHYGYPNNLRFQ